LPECPAHSKHPKGPKEEAAAIEVLII
jgi:hypothetical protein